VNGAYYCDVLLLKQLLPDICQAAGDICFATQDSGLYTRVGLQTDQTSVLQATDYWVIQECVCQKQQRMSNLV